MGGKRQVAEIAQMPDGILRPTVRFQLATSAQFISSTEANGRRDSTRVRSEPK